MRLFILFIVISVSATCLTQESINTTGSTGTGSGGTTCYTVGQVVYSTYSNAYGTINQGVQQTYILIDSTGGFEDILTDLNIKVFPNPTTDVLHLSIGDLHDTQLCYTLLDASQRTLLTNQLLSCSMSINLADYESGTYFLFVEDSSGKRKIFKIIKQ